jgi:hypothetical protein
MLLAIVVAGVLALPAGIALAAHQFGDVPNSNIFHSDIDALVDSGVTAGCGSGNYCPNQAVTRGQMAAFLNRLGALAPGKTPVVNADRVDGLHAVSFGRAGVDVLANGNLGQWFNRGGGAPSIEKAGTGLYRITIPGKSFNINSNFVGSVTLTDLGFGTINSIGGTRVQVQTYDASGVAADRHFQVIVWDAD